MSKEPSATFLQIPKSLTAKHPNLSLTIGQQQLLPDEHYINVSLLPPKESEASQAFTLQSPWLIMETTRCTTCGLLADSLVTIILVRCYPFASFFHYHNQVQSFQSSMLTIFSKSMVFYLCSNNKLSTTRYEKISQL